MADQKEPAVQPLPALAEVDALDYRGGKLRRLKPTETVKKCSGSMAAPVPLVSPLLARLDQKEEPHPPKKVYVILNPHGGNGRGKKAWAAAEPVFKKAGLQYELLETKAARHATELARDKPLDGVDAIVVVGDTPWTSTINEVIKGLFSRPDGRKVPLGLIPGGTGNSVKVTLNELDPAASAETVVKGFVCNIDLGLVRAQEGDFYMFNILGWGLAADANETAESFRCCGMLRYDIGAVVQIVKNVDRNLDVEVDGCSLNGNYAFGMVQNNQHSGVKLRFAPLAKLDDGYFDLVLYPKSSRGDTLKAFDLLKAGAVHIYDPKFVYCRFKKLKVDDPKARALVNVDGENCCRTPITLEMLPGALLIFYNPDLYRAMKEPVFENA